MPQSALLAHDLVRTLGARRMLDGISLTVAPGQRIGLITASQKVLSSIASTFAADYRNGKHWNSASAG